MYNLEIILNPDKLYDIQYVEVPDLLGEDEREELRDYIIRNYDYDPEEDWDDEDWMMRIGVRIKSKGSSMM